MFNRIRSWLGFGSSREHGGPDSRRRGSPRDDHLAAGAGAMIASGAVSGDSDRTDVDGGHDGGSGGGATDSGGGWGGGDSGGGGGGDGGGSV